MLQISDRPPTGRGAPAAPPWVPALASLALPGLGQLLNKQRAKALIWFVVPLIVLVIELSTSQWGRYLTLVRGGVPEDRFATEADHGYYEGDASLDQSFESLGALFGSFDSSAPAEGDGDPFASDGDPFGAPAEGDGDPFGSGDPFGGTAEGDGDPFGSGDYESAGPSYFDAQYMWPRFAEGEPRYLFRNFGGFFTRGVWGLVTLGRLIIGTPYADTTIELFNKITPWMSADNSVVLLGNGLIAAASLLIFGALWALGVADAYATRKAMRKSGRIETFKEFWLRTWDGLYVYIVSAPAFIMILMFTVIPIFFTFLLAFTNYTYQIKLGARLIEWVGFNTFKFLSLDQGWLSIFGQIFLWTATWAFMSSVTVYALGFFNALVVESPLVKGKKIWRTIMILPWAIPALVSLMVFRNVFDKDGLMNQLLFATGLMEPVSNFLFRIGLAGQADAPIFWFQPIYNGKLARFVTVLVNLWLGAPYHMMMIIGVLSTIPRELYEAAAIDGAKAFQRFRYITLPMVLAATVPALIMTFSFNFNNFGAVYFLTGGGPAWDPGKVPESMRVIGSALPGQTDILISWIYKLSFTRGSEQYNVAAAYSIIIFMVVGAFAVFNMLKSKSFQEEAGE